MMQLFYQLLSRGSGSVLQAVFSVPLATAMSPAGHHRWSWRLDLNLQSRVAAIYTDDVEPR